MYHEATFRATNPDFWEVHKIFARIGRLKDSFGERPSPRARAEALIGACILEGVDTQYEIVKMLGTMGLSKNLVRKVLEGRTGPLSGDHLWQRSEEGLYRLN